MRSGSASPPVPLGVSTQGLGHCSRTAARKLLRGAAPSGTLFWTSGCTVGGGQGCHGAGRLSFFRRHQCLLICGRCGNALATARVGPIALIRVRHATGHDVAPLQAAVAARVAAARVSAAEAAAQQVGRRPEDDLEVLAARHEVDYLRRQVGEIAFYLQCPSCESRYWRSLPHLANEDRSAPADQVTLTY